MGKVTNNTIILSFITLLTLPLTLAYTGVSPLDSALTMVGNLFSFDALQNPTVALGVARLAWFILLFAVFAYAARKVFSQGDNAGLDKKTAHIVAFVIAAISTFFTPMNVLMTATTGYAAFIWSLIIVGPAILALYLGFGTEKARSSEATTGQRLIEFVILGAGFLWTSFMLGTLIEWMRNQFPQVSGIVEASAGYMSLIMLIALVVKLFQLLGAGNWSVLNNITHSKDPTPSNKTPEAPQEETKVDKDRRSEHEPESERQAIDFSIQLDEVSQTAIQQDDQEFQAVKTRFTITGPQAPYGIRVFYFKRGEENKLQQLITTNKTEKDHDWFPGKPFFSARAGVNEQIFEIHYDNLKEKYFVIAAFISGQVRYDAVYIDEQGNPHAQQLPETKQESTTPEAPQEEQATAQDPRRTIRQVNSEEPPGAFARRLENKVAFYLTSDDNQEVRVKLIIQDAQGNELETKQENNQGLAGDNSTKTFVYPIRNDAQIYLLELLSHELVNGQAIKTLSDGSRQKNQLTNGLIVNVEGAQSVIVNAQIRHSGSQQESPTTQESPQEPTATPQESSRTLHGAEKGGVSNRINNLVTKINELGDDLNEEPDVPGHWLNKHQIACVDKLSELLRKLRETEQGRKAIQELETNFSNSREKTAKQYVIKLLIRDKNEFSSNIKKRSNQYQTIFRGYERRTGRPITHKEIATILQEIAQFLEQKKQEFMEVNN